MIDIVEIMGVVTKNVVLVVDPANAQPREVAEPEKRGRADANASDLDDDRAVIVGVILAARALSKAGGSLATMLDAAGEAGLG